MIPRMLAALLVLGAVFFAGCGGGDQAGQASGQKYHCPMHPTYVSDRPGDCPICNMKLVPIKEGGKTAAKPAKRGTGEYTCPMHPEFVTNNAAALCPECNMKLKPKAAAASKNDFTCPMHPEFGTNNPAALCPECNMKLKPRAEVKEKSDGPPGRIAIAISPETRHLIGLTLSKVEPRELTRTVRTTAAAEHDETTLARIAPRFAGWVRDLRINFTGQHVEKGEPLLTVYSPDLMAAENEYLLAFRRLEEMRKANPQDGQLESVRRLAESARRKLELWQIGEEEIAELEKTGESKDALLLRSPVSGHVVAKTAVEGKSFMAGETLYEIADLSKVWLRASVPEQDLPLIKTGAKATVSLPYASGKTHESTVTFIYPHIDPQTRRAEVRLEVDNPGHHLRPGMWANVDIHAQLGTLLTVPASAVIDTGERFVAFVDGEDEHLEPREVKVGVKTDDYIEVLGGLEEGEQVVTRALFLVDSESQLKAAIAGMTSAGGHQH